MAEISDDLPALGNPTRPASATVLSSSTRVCSAPGSPRKAKPGALRLGVASAALPSPPRPPWAATNLVPAPIRSASTSPSSVVTTVPSGTGTTRSPPSAPLRFEPEPCLPLAARRSGRRCRSSSVAMPGCTSKITSPPRPPLPPSGPPSGLNFSRCTDAQPWPPSPALTRNVTWSANSATFDNLPGDNMRQGGPSGGPPLCVSLRVALRPGGPAPGGSGGSPPGLALRGLRRSWPEASEQGKAGSGALVRRRGARGGGLDHAHGSALAHLAKRDHAGDEREQGVILAAADAGAWVEVGAALAHDDLARVDLLAAEPLDAKALRV